MVEGGNEEVKGLPGRVLESLLVVEGHEEAVDGEKHDNVASHDQSAGTPSNRGVGAGCPGQYDGQGERRENDSGGEKVADLLQGRRTAAHVVRETPRDQDRDRSQQVEGHHEKRPPIVVFRQSAGEEQEEQPDGPGEGQTDQRLYSSHFWLDFWFK